MNLYDLMLIAPAVLTAYVISYISMPAIIRIAELKEFIDSPDGKRKLHKRFVPTMGGIGIFAAFMISYSVWGQVVSLGTFPFFIAALLILFLMGVRDDIVELTPFKKFLIQLVASVILVLGGGISLGSFIGLFGIGDLGFAGGSVASVVILISIINAYNLIDGIDGLAGGVGVIASSILGIWFWGAGFLSLTILSFSLSGALIGFLAFNMYPARIFMGDTGAMSIGFILGYLSLEFLILNHGLTAQPWHVLNGEVLAVSILIIPIIDTLRVIVIRLKNGKSPFEGDRNHIHHEILDLGISHLHSAFILWLVNIFMIGAAYLTMPLNINIQLLVIIAIGLSFLPFIKFVYKISAKTFNFETKNDSQKSAKTAYDMK
jgi:UDP-N-acetylmuramyl pentapeptide phosphotransferase/UDP-N-acetylglucosamine-1-phosphate transferase